MHTEAIRQHNHYQQVRSRLWPVKTVNVAVEEKRLIEAYRKEQRRQFEESMAAAAEGKRQEEFRRQRYASFLAACASGFGTRGTASGRLSLEGDHPASVFLVGAHRPSLKQISLRVLASHPGVNLDDVKGDSRKNKIMLARRHVIAAIRSLRPDVSYPEIGRFLNKDHSTCVHAVQKFFKSETWLVEDFNMLWTASKTMTIG